MGYCDLQVNGYAGVDFNQDDMTPEQLHACCLRLADDGVDHILATIITDHADAMMRRLSNLARLRSQDALAGQIISGIHVEGPFLSPLTGYRGAHPLDAIRPAEPDLMRRMYDCCDGLLRLVTLAPEQDDSCQTIRWLKSKNVHVSGGHSDASFEQLRHAADAGLAIWTHLGNGCPMQMHRHDNIIQRVLSLADQIRPCFIADGVHVPLFALRNYIRTAGVQRIIIVTDAMAAAGLGPGRHKLGRWEVDVGHDLAAWAPDRSHLLGSANTMRNSVRNLQDMGLSDYDITMMTQQNPLSLL